MSLDPPASQRPLRSSEVTSPEFESGFPTDQDSAALCPICFGVPRYPLETPDCGHFICAGCLQRHIELNGQPQGGPLQTRVFRCPYCATAHASFTLADFIPYDNFSSGTKLMWRSIQVSCRKKCGYVGDIIQVDEHEVYQCLKRQVQCTNFGCLECVEFQQLQTHLSVCNLHYRPCINCGLLVNETSIENHVCLEALKTALVGNLSYFQIDLKIDFLFIFNLRAF